MNCPICKSSSYAICDIKFGARFKPGKQRRCVECKTVYHNTNEIGKINPNLLDLIVLPDDPSVSWLLTGKPDNCPGYTPDGGYWLINAEGFYKRLNATDLILE